MSEFGDKEIANEDGSSYVCTSSDGSVQALVWDCTVSETGKLFNQGYFISPRPSATVSPVSLELSGIKNGKYRLEIYKVGYKENDPFTRYLEMGRPQHTSIQQEKELAGYSLGLPVSTSVITITNGKFNRQLPLRENDIVFVKLVKTN